MGGFESWCDMIRSVTFPGCRWGVVCGGWRVRAQTGMAVPSRDGGKDEGLRRKSWTESLRALWSAVGAAEGLRWVARLPRK